jgi:superoxide dismutase, Fe-Mn family
MAFVLPELTYPFDGLEPHIDARTVEIHYTKHHATYLANFNKALEKYPQFYEKSIEWILANLDQIPEDIRTVVKNNGGGYYNHNLYWENMGPNQGGEPKGKLLEAIRKAYGDVGPMKAEMEKTGLGRLGSGYSWLCQKKDGSLVILATLNQDSPVTDGLKPLLVVDVWEHAYYLKYQNRRAEYLTNWWNLVNWDVVQKRFDH